MLFRLLIDLEALNQLNELSPRSRRAMMDHLRKIQNYPGNHSHHVEQDFIGRRLDVSIFGGFHIFYWVDTADAHIKILRLAKK